MPSMSIKLLSVDKLCVCRGVAVVCCRLFLSLPGLTSIKLSFLNTLEKRIQKIYTFTYLRFFLFTLESIQSKNVAAMKKAKNKAVNIPPPYLLIQNYAKVKHFQHL